MKNTLRHAVLGYLLFANPLAAQESGFIGLRLDNLGAGSPCVAIASVLPGGPADRAGLKAGDKISKVNDKELACPVAATERPLPLLAVHEELRLEVTRAGGKLDVTIKAESAPPGLAEPSKAAQDRETRFQAGMALTRRIVESKIFFVIVMDENGEYHYEGDLTPEEAKLLHWFDYETMAGPQMQKFFKPGRHELYMAFNKVRNSYDYEYAVKSEPQ